MQRYGQRAEGREEVRKSGIRWNVADLNEKQLAALKQGGEIAVITPKKPRRSKFGAIPTTVEGKTFHSKKEARICEVLKLRPEVKFILRQIPFDIPGGFKHCVDFMLYHHDGTVSFAEAKGYDNRLGNLKRRQVEEIYGITIEVL